MEKSSNLILAYTVYRYGFNQWAIAVRILGLHHNIQANITPKGKFTDPLSGIQDKTSFETLQLLGWSGTEF